MFNGIVEVNSVVSIFDNGVLVVIVNVNVSGNWSWMLIVVFGQGGYVYSVSVVDVVGNVSVVLLLIMIIVDIIVFGVFGNLVINVIGNWVMGIVEVGSIVMIIFDIGVVLGIVIVDGIGSFIVIFMFVQINGQLLLVFVQDKVGNIGIVVGFSVFDMCVLEVLIIINVVDDVGIYIGVIVNGQVINDV